MNDFRKTLIDRMVKVYGYEHKITLFFARCCDNQYISDEFLERLVRDHEARPYVDGEEEEM